MTSGDEDDYLACSYKTVIHRPVNPPAPHFYLAPTADTPSITAPSHLPVLGLPSPPVNSPIHHRAHTDTDLLFYTQQPVPYPVHWYPSGAFIYPHAPPDAHVHMPSPPFLVHATPQQQQHHQARSSSADCRRTVSNGDSEPRVVHPERVW